MRNLRTVFIAKSLKFLRSKLTSNYSIAYVAECGENIGYHSLEVTRDGFKYSVDFNIINYAYNLYRKNDQAWKDLLLNVIK